MTQVEGGDMIGYTEVTTLSGVDTMSFSYDRTVTLQRTNRTTPVSAQCSASRTERYYIES